MNYQELKNFLVEKGMSNINFECSIEWKCGNENINALTSYNSSLVEELAQAFGLEAEEWKERGNVTKFGVIFNQKTI